MQTFAELCKDERDRRWYSLADMAHLTGFSVRTWERWEDGTRIPRPASARFVANRLGIPLQIVREAVEESHRQRATP